MVFLAKQPAVDDAKKKLMKDIEEQFAILQRVNELKKVYNVNLLYSQNEAIQNAKCKKFFFSLCQYSTFRQKVK